MMRKNRSGYRREIIHLQRLAASFVVLVVGVAMMTGIAGEVFGWAEIPPDVHPLVSWTADIEARNAWQPWSEPQGPQAMDANALEPRVESQTLQLDRPPPMSI